MVMVEVWIHGLLTMVFSGERTKKNHTNNKISINLCIWFIFGHSIEIIAMTGNENNNTYLVICKQPFWLENLKKKDVI